MTQHTTIAAAFLITTQTICLSLSCTQARTIPRASGRETPRASGRETSSPHLRGGTKLIPLEIAKQPLHNRASLDLQQRATAVQLLVAPENHD